MNKRALLKSIGLSESQLEILQIILGSFVLFACSQISIPLQPVPITLQSAAVLFIGLVYTKRAALKAVTLYLVAGLLGVPVFANFSFGPATLFGPTGGYLWGFVLAIYFMATVSQLKNMDSFFGMCLNGLVGTLVIFIPGVLWLAKFVGISQAFIFGVMPFVIPGVFKAVSVALAIRAIRKPNG